MGVRARGRERRYLIIQNQTVIQVGNAAAEVHGLLG